MNTYEIAGGDGLTIAVREYGNRDGLPILFIHGLMQSGLSWARQIGGALHEDFRLLCMDVRGHGASGAAPSPDGYQDSRLLADDVAAVIETLGLTRPILVGASYGGIVINDYIKHYGDRELGGINYVASVVHFGNDKAAAHLGPDLGDLVPGLLSADLPEMISATRKFVRLFYATQPQQETFETVLAYNMMVPVATRLALASREVDGDEVLRSIRCPVRVTHGTADKIVLPSMSEAICAKIPHAHLSLYEGAGHTTYGEMPDRFNSELAEFTRTCASELV